MTYELGYHAAASQHRKTCCIAASRLRLLIKSSASKLRRSWNGGRVPVEEQLPRGYALVSIAQSLWPAASSTMKRVQGRILALLAALCVPCCADRMAYKVDVIYSDQLCQRRPVRARVSSVLEGTCQDQPSCNANRTSTVCTNNFLDALHTAFGNNPYLVTQTYDSSSCNNFLAARAYLADNTCFAAGDTYITVAIDPNGTVEKMYTCGKYPDGPSDVIPAEVLREATCVDGRRYMLVNGENYTNVTVTSTSLDKRSPMAMAVIGIIVGVFAVVLVVAVSVVRLTQRARSAFTSSHPEHDIENCLPVASPRSTIGELDPQLLQYRRSVSDIKDKRVLGAGSFCETWLIQYRGGPWFVAKRLRDEQPTLTQLNHFVKIIKLCASLVHPRVVQFHGVAWSNDMDVQALFEFANHGNAGMWLQAPSTPRHWTPQKLRIALDVCEALAYVHSFAPAVVHRNLKASNVMLMDDGRAKLTDFGMARLQAAQQLLLGLAPEVLSGKQQHDTRSDIFAFGGFLSELDTHQAPFSDACDASGAALSSSVILRQIATGDLKPQLSPRCPQELVDVIHQCCSFAPEDRPSATELLKLLARLSQHVCTLVPHQQVGETTERLSL